MSQDNDDKNKKTCFVIMPFSDPDKSEASKKKWDQIFLFIERCVTKATNDSYRVFRSEATTGSITDEIYENLNTADLVIADCTNKNSNVFYELGIRHCKKIGTIILSQNKESIPFDLQDLAYHLYNFNSQEGVDDDFIDEAFVNDLRKLIHYVEHNPDKPDSSVGKKLGYVGIPSKINKKRMESITQKMNSYSQEERKAIKYMLIEKKIVTNEFLYKNHNISQQRINFIVNDWVFIDAGAGNGFFQKEGIGSCTRQKYKINPDKESYLEMYFEKNSI